MPNTSHILLVDDEEDIRRLYKTKLERAGFTVFTASDEEKSIIVAKRENPDLIIMDIKMPKMDGITAQKILKEKPTTGKLPLVFLSAFNDNTVSDSYKQYTSTEGVAGIIKKGISLDEMVTEVKKYLPNHTN